MLCTVLDNQCCIVTLMRWHGGLPLVYIEQPMVKLVLSSSISLKAAEPISRHQLRTYYIPLQRNVHQPTSAALRFSAEVVSHTALINPYFPQKLSGTPNPGKLFSENATATQNQYGDHLHHLTPIYLRSN